MLLDDAAVEIAELPVVLRRIQIALRSIPDAEREYLAQALLNYAVAQAKAQTVTVTREVRPED